MKRRERSFALLACGHDQRSGLIAPFSTTRVFGHNANRIIQHLQETAFNAKTTGASTAAQSQLSLSQESHHGCVPGKNANLAVIRGRDKAVHLLCWSRELFRLEVASNGHFEGCLCTW